MDLTAAGPLVRSRERVEDVDALVGLLGRRVGLEGVLEDLDRTATLARVPSKAAAWGFRWDREDDRSRRWWPQGVSSSADHSSSELAHGRRVLCTSWYAKPVGGAEQGARVTFVDVTDPDRLRYRHVLLVEPVPDRHTGRPTVRPVRLHAGGIVWRGPYLHVAATFRGIWTFRLDDVLQVPGRGPTSPGAPSPGGVESFGYRYLLPLRLTYDAAAGPAGDRLRYSFLSLDRSTRPVQLVTGEYGRGNQPTRLARYALDPETSLPRVRGDRAEPLAVETTGLRSMQGAVVVDGTYYVGTSAGPRRRGSLHVGAPGSFTARRGVLPVGPEDLAYWPGTGQLWSLTEYPRRRYVFAMNRADLAAPSRPRGPFRRAALP